MVAPNATKAVLFVVDGMRPDGMRQADTPVMDRLVDSGVHTLSAQTVLPSITLPCHMSLFLSALPAQHGITTNTWQPTARNMPGLMEVLHGNGRRAASFYNWEELRDVSRPGSLEAGFYPCGPNDEAGDGTVAALAARWLHLHEVEFAFVYLGYVDVVGHAFGWMSDEYLRAISGADEYIGEVLDVLAPDTLVVVTSDHGGHGHAHGTDRDEDMTIPLVISGPGASSGDELTGEVTILDIAPTVTSFLGLDSPDEWAGRPILPARTDISRTDTCDDDTS